MSDLSKSLQLKKKKHKNVQEPHLIICEKKITVILIHRGLSHGCNIFILFRIVSNLSELYYFKMATTTPLAEKIGKNLLQCAICHEQLRDPRALPCQHGFCLECLQSWAEKSQVKGTLSCPTCREDVNLPKDGVKGLPVHFLVSSLKDIYEEVQEVRRSEPTYNMPVLGCARGGMISKTGRLYTYSLLTSVGQAKEMT